MAEENSGSGATPWLAFLVGGLVVVVAVVLYFLYSGGMGQTRQVDVNVTAPEISAPAAPSGG